MAEVVLFHDAHGVTPGCHAFADRLRTAGHAVHIPDLYEGLVFTDLNEGIRHAEQLGIASLIERGRQAAEDLPDAVVYAGFSLGALPAQALVQTKPGAAGALLFERCSPFSEFGERWPDGVPLQIHMKDQDGSSGIEIARKLVGGVEDAELFLYPGDDRPFTENLADHDAAASAVLTERVLQFLAGFPRRAEIVNTEGQAQAKKQRERQEAAEGRALTDLGVAMAGVRQALQARDHAVASYFASARKKPAARQLITKLTGITRPQLLSLYALRAPKSFHLETNAAFDELAGDSVGPLWCRDPFGQRGISATGGLIHPGETHRSLFPKERRAAGGQPTVWAKFVEDEYGSVDRPSWRKALAQEGDAYIDAVISGIRQWVQGMPARSEIRILLYDPDHAVLVDETIFGGAQGS